MLHDSIMIEKTIAWLLSFLMQKEKSSGEDDLLTVPFFFRDMLCHKQSNEKNDR